MKRFKDILVVAPRDTDMTEPMRAAERLAAANRARVTVFDVLEPLSFGSKSTIGSYGPEYVNRLLAESRRGELEAVARSAPTVPVRVATATGTPFLEIVRRVLSYEHDLVIVPPDQPTGIAGLARASTTMHLLRKCPVPVWVYRPEVPAGGDVLAAVGPFDDGAPTPLDRKLVELGSSLAVMQGSRFHLVHAWELAGESLLRNGRIKMPAPEVDRLVEGAAQDASTALEKLLAEAGIDRETVEIHTAKGRPVSAIIEVAERIAPAVVVMGTVARGGIAGLLIGNTAETTLGSLSSSVMAVKPEGFMSPVEVPDRPRARADEA